MNEPAADDVELLHRYVAEASEAAFAELVRGRVDLVYSAALRRVGGDAHLAEDVTQQVFVALARDARALAGRASLVGWLYTTTRFAAAQAVRTERRRRAREEEAEIMKQQTTEETAAADWDRLRPVLDAAMDELKAAERDAVLLRFFAGQTYAEIGAKLSLGENTVRMRVERALDELQGLLAKRGVTSTAGALAVALSSQTVTAAPAGLAATVTGVALAAGAGGGVLVAAGSFLTMSKLQIGIMTAVVAAGTAGFVWQRQANRRLEAAFVRLQGQQQETARREAAEQRRSIATAAELAAFQARSTEVAKGREGGAPAATTERASAMQSVAPAAPALARGLVPVETLGDTGRATPRAAFATQLWAARTGDVELEASSLALSAEARARLEALRAVLPESVRVQYPTPEKLMAFLLAGSPHPVGGMQVLGETVEGDHDVVLHAQWQHGDDAVVHTSDLHFQLAADGWRWVVPNALVDRAAAYAGRSQAAPTAAGHP